MKTLSTLALALAACTLSAQEVGALDARIQAYAELTRPSAFNLSSAGAPVTDQADRQAGFGLRLLGELPFTNGWYYELGGRFDSSSRLGYNTAAMNNTDVTVSYSYWSAGAAYLWNLGPATLGAHAEARGEAIRLQGTQFKDGTGAQVSQSSTYVRPWVRLSLDFTFGSGGVRPFVGADVATAVTKTNQTVASSLPSMDERSLRSLAPKASATVYAGVRF